jgi:hypothetical protein
MPQLKEPMRLGEICIRLYVRKCCGKCEEWVRDLIEASRRGTRTFLIASNSVLYECRQIEEKITKLPPGIIKLLSPRLTKKFAKLICSCQNDFRRPLTDFPGNRINASCSCQSDFRRPRPDFPGNRINASVWKAIFRSVLTRFVERFDQRLMTNELESAIMVQNLDSMPGLLELYLDCWYCDHSTLLAGIVHLENLQIFTYPCHCTDEIIAQLQRHCPHLTKLDVSGSLKVTNACVQPLRAARKLKFLNLYETRIDDEDYGLLLSELPNVANITFWRHEASSILRHIAVERLDTITHAKGYIQDIDTVAHKCPNITNITMCRNTGDLSGLTAFNALRALEIRPLYYGSSNFKAVLQGVGHRLTDLKLVGGESVDLQDIVTLCPSLANLHCSFLYLSLKTPLDPQLPHFANLINLQIRRPVEFQDVGRYIQYYVNLKTIYLVLTSSITVEFVNEILKLGTYKQLEVLRVEEYWWKNINVKALQLLIQHCPLLKRIEIVAFHYEFDSHVFDELRHQILLQNFELKFKQICTDAI